MTELLAGGDGACRSKVGVEAIEEPCTNRTVPRSGPAVRFFSHRKIFWSFLTSIQCSRPLALGAVIASLIASSLGLVGARKHAQRAFVERDRDALTGGEFVARMAFHPQEGARPDFDHKL